MKIQLIFYLFSIFILMSCRRTNKLSKDDYMWMPYKGNETLVFRSNTNVVDTIFILKKDTLFGYPEPLSMKGTRYEILSIYAKHTDPTGGEHRYLENRLFELSKGKSKRAELKIYFLAEDACFYRSSRIKIDSLNKEKPLVLQTKYGNYNDVYIFKGEDELAFGRRSDFITKLYWSKSNGVIRYDKKDSVYWELAKKW